jgi:hypothetical protein
LRGSLGVHRCRERRRRVAVAQLAAVRLVDTGEHLDQGGLAGTVLADECVHLTGAQGERHIVERPYAGKLLADTGHFEQRHVPPPSVITFTHCPTLSVKCKHRSHGYGAGRLAADRPRTRWFVAYPPVSGAALFQVTSAA